MGYVPLIPDVWMKMTTSEDVSGTSIGNYNGYTNTFGINTTSVSTAVTITEKDNRSCAYLTQTGYIKFPSGNLSIFCLMCYVYVDSNTTNWSRLLKMTGEGGVQGGGDITVSSSGILAGNNSPYDGTSSTWVHLKINYDINNSSITKDVFIDDVFMQSYTQTNGSINTNNFVMGQQHQNSLKSKFYIYDFKLYKGIHL
jgi:hypothetical protein